MLIKKFSLYFTKSTSKIFHCVCVLMFKKIIKYLLVTLLSKRMYENRKPYIQFIFRNLENFIILLISFYYKILNPKYLFLPYRHTVGLFYLLKICKILNDLKIEYFFNSRSFVRCSKTESFCGWT